MPLAADTSLMIGPAQTLTQSVVYSLPARACRMHSTLALEISPDETAWDALTGVETVGAEVGSAFVRCTTGAPVVVLKAL